jgi:hypothetical protein
LPLNGAGKIDRAAAEAQLQAAYQRLGSSLASDVGT